MGFILTIAAYFVFFKGCYLLGLSVDIHLPFIKIVFFVTFANLLSFLPISFSGIGTREGSLVYLFSTENLSGESALAFSVLIFATTYLLFGVVGFVSFMNLKYNKKGKLNA